MLMKSNNRSAKHVQLGITVNRDRLTPFHVHQATIARRTLAQKHLAQKGNMQAFQNLQNARSVALGSIKMKPDKEHAKNVPLGVHL
jgi:hypothetical protein